MKAEFDAWFASQASESEQFRQAMCRAFEAGIQAESKPSPVVPSPVLDEALRARELFAAAVAAGQAYDYQFRPHGRSWGRVTDEQAARIVEGALLHLGGAAEGKTGS